MTACACRDLAPGAVHLPNWLDHEQQRTLVEASHTWATGPVPIRVAVLAGGRRMLVKTVCLGWHWHPYKYTRATVEVNGRQVLDLPNWLADLGRDVLSDAYDQASAETWHPDTALANLSFNLISIHIGSYAEYSPICPGDV